MLVFFAALLILTAGCTTTDAASPKSSSGDIQVVALDDLLPLDSNNAGTLSDVVVRVVKTGAVLFPSPESRAAERYVGRLEVTVPGSTHGVGADIVVPMWYDEATTYTMLSQPTERLVDVIPTDEPDLNGTLGDIRYRLVDGVFYLAHMQARMHR